MTARRNTQRSTGALEVKAPRQTPASTHDSSAGNSLLDVLELLPDAIVVAGRDGNISMVNGQAAAMFGYPRGALLGQPIEVLVPDSMRHIHRRHRERYATDPHTRAMGANLRLNGRRQDGSVFPVEVSLSPLTGFAEHRTAMHGDQPTSDQPRGTASAAPGPRDFAVIAAIRDVTERQRLEAARMEAEAATEELRRVQTITDVALLHHTLKPLLPALLDQVLAVMHADSAAILLIEDAVAGVVGAPSGIVDAAEAQGVSASVLRVRAVRGLEEEVAAAVRVPVGQGFAGRIADTREPLVVDDLSTIPVVSAYLHQKVRSAVGVPLVVSDRLIGVLHVDSVPSRVFSEREVRLLQLVAERAALAIEQARLTENEQEATARARLTEARFQRLVDANLIGLIIIEGETVIEANDAFLRLVGYAHEDVRAGALRWRALTPSEESERGVRARTELRLTGACAPVERECLHRDGHHVPVLVGSALLDREPLRVVTFVVDLTERRWLEHQREAAQARELALQEVNQHLDQFFATAAHDIRNPVTAVVGAIHLARLCFASVAAVASCVGGAAEQAHAAFPAPGRPTNGVQQLAALNEGLELAEQGAERLSQLVTRLFDVAKARTGNLDVHLAPLDLAALVEQQVRAQRASAPERTIRLERARGSSTLPSGFPSSASESSSADVVVMVDADADRLGQVVANYLTNALKYSPAREPVTVAVEVTDGVAVVSVQDAGPGLPLDEQVRVWEMFHRAPDVQGQSDSGADHTTAGSLGLGLHICKRIVELHHGRVGVESTVGLGSTFWFSLLLATH